MRLLNLFQSTLILVFVRRVHSAPVICVWLDISPDGGLGELPDPAQPAVRHLTGVSHQVGGHKISVCHDQGRAGHPGPHLTEGSLVSTIITYLLVV